MPPIVSISIVFNPKIMKCKFKKAYGQALIEYLLIFSFVTFIGINITKGLGTTMLQSVGYIGYELTEQFTIGVCGKNQCFFSGYLNEESVK